MMSSEPSTTLSPTTSAMNESAAMEKQDDYVQSMIACKGKQKKTRNRKKHQALDVHQEEAKKEKVRKDELRRRPAQKVKRSFKRQAAGTQDPR